jgi:hypothetical protein
MELEESSRRPSIRRKCVPLLYNLIHLWSLARPRIAQQHPGPHTLDNLLKIGVMIVSVLSEFAASACEEQT